MPRLSDILSFLTGIVFECDEGYVEAGWGVGNDAGFVALGPDLADVLLEGSVADVGGKAGVVDVD